jgi:hypothetical protein
MDALLLCFSRTPENPIQLSPFGLSISCVKLSSEPIQLDYSVQFMLLAIAPFANLSTFSHMSERPVGGTESNI